MPSSFCTGVISALSEPERLSLRAAQDWPPLLRSARRAGLLGRLASIMAERGLLPTVPEAPRRHLEAELVVATKHRRDVLWEIECIRRALASLDIPIVLLKGGAYAIADLPSARGRIFGDIDVLVAREAIPEVERALKKGGWRTTEVDRWDERFYREWMHEIPPMVHDFRETLVDVHHTIVPPTARVKLAASHLFEAARPVPGKGGLLTLGPADMVAHSATHLFNEGEFDRGLRDLVDLDSLLRHFSAEADFWQGLLPRARQLDLERPVFYALRYCSRILGTPVPEEILARAEACGPSPLFRGIMDALFERAVAPDDPESGIHPSRLARTALYIRGHWLRLPPRLLFPHLLRKAVIGRFR